MITRNLNKEAGVCNGTFGKVIGFQRDLIFVDIDGTEHVVHKWTDDRCTGSFYPVVLGYATTLAKTQGLTLDHVTIVPDINGVPGAGYTAVSRVRSMATLHFLCAAEKAFFVPVSQVQQY